MAEFTPSIIRTSRSRELEGCPSSSPRGGLIDGH